jgi:5,10-methylenetetrahydromethanopterin reductase
VELWTFGSPAARTVGQAAAKAETAGFDGFAVVDTQNLAGDCYVALTLAAGATRHIGLGTAVTNPVTRHPAATAAAIASIQEASGGRATLAIGRGDSSLAQLGQPPASVAVLERYLVALQSYLRGDEVPLEALGTRQGAPALSGASTASRLAWLDRSLPKVPVEVAASGPRVLGAAARHADRVMLAVGAEPDRLAWAAEVVRAARQQAGFGPDGFGFSAYVHVGCHPDPEVARSLIQPGLSTLARYASTHGRVHGPLAEGDREILAEVNRRWSTPGGAAGQLLPAAAFTPGFVERLAVVGPPQRCVRRLREVLAIGIDKLLINGGGVRDPEINLEAARLLTAEVLPALRETPG